MKNKGREGEKKETKGRIHRNERRIMRDCGYGLVVREEDEKGLKKNTQEKSYGEKEPDRRC